MLLACVADLRVACVTSLCVGSSILGLCRGHCCPVLLAHGCYHVLTIDDSTVSLFPKAFVKEAAINAVTALYVHSSDVVVIRMPG